MMVGTQPHRDLGGKGSITGQGGARAETLRETGQRRPCDWIRAGRGDCL